MRNIQKGSLIGIPCETSDGAFEEEILVEFKTLDGIISGFTSPENVRENDGQNYIKAEVISIEHDHFVVMVEGSFFSTNGLANVNSNQFISLAA